MDNITITFNTILQLFGAIAVVGGGVKILVGMFSPFRELKAEIESIKDKLHNDNERLKKGDIKLEEIDKRLDAQDEALAMLGLSLSELMNHMLTGNDTDALKKRQKELNRYFYKRKEKEHE
jgi:predicted nuclease with TOPRIM domain